MRRFATPMTLRLSPAVIELASADGVVQSVPARHLLETTGGAEKVLRQLFRRVPPSRGILRPVVVVHGLPSLQAILAGQQYEIVTRALSACGAAAAVIADDPEQHV